MPYLISLFALISVNKMSLREEFSPIVAFKSLQQIYSVFQRKLLVRKYYHNREYKKYVKSMAHWCTMPL